MSKSDLNCSFCGRPKPETQLLIAGLDAHICDRCIVQAHGIVQEEDVSSETKEASIELKPPKEIKSFTKCLLTTTNSPLSVRLV